MERAEGLQRAHGDEMMMMMMTMVMEEGAEH